jgi:hypothetical protein
MSGIKILKALYGVGSNTVDVTASVASHIRDGTLNLVVTSDSLNVQDPAPGQQKTLDVSYTINDGSTNGQMVKDNELLVISAPPVTEASGLQIIKAGYGYPGNFTDVTDAIQNHVKDGSINVKITPANMGVPDPNPNKQKMLDVEYTLNGAKNISVYKDNETFRISAPPKDAADSKTPGQHVMSAAGVVYKNVAMFIGIFLQTLSVFTAMDYGGPEGLPRYVLGGIAFIIPYFSFWALPIYVMIRRIFSTTDLVV